MSDKLGKMVAVIGVPSTVGCRPETAEIIDQDRAPQAIRSAFTELMQGFNIPTPFVDRGDLSVIGERVLERVLTQLTDAVIDERQKGNVPLILGGAHTVTLGALRALAKTDPGFSLVYLDAHPDLMPRAEINYGSSIYHALKEGVLAPNRLAYLGIRHVELEEESIIKERQIFARSAIDIALHGVKETVLQLRHAVPPPYAISLDFDAIDPAFAPGVTVPYPAGLSPLDVLSIIHQLAREDVICAELMELSPANDKDKRTQALAGEMLFRVAKSLAG